MSADEALAAPTPPRSPRRRLWPRVVAAILLALAILAAIVYVALGSQAALDYVVRRAIASAEGHLTIEGAEGSLLSTVRIARIAWKGDELDVEARETAVAWSPLDLVSRKLIVQGLGAKRLSLEFKKSQKTQSGLPASLALPLEVEVRHIGVERLEWKTAEQSGFVTGIVFGYAGGARAHEISDVRFVTEQGTLGGHARMGANPPYDLDAALDFEGDGDWKGGKAQLSVAGTLERLAIDAKGSLHDAELSVKAGVAPFATALVTSADIDARNVDLAQFVSSLPATGLSLTLTARPEGAGFAGTLRARNEKAGAIDAGRIPVTALSSAFAWDGQALALSDIDAEIAGGARARGSVSVPKGGTPVKLDLALANVDLSRIMGSLIATRLSGTLAGEVEKDRQVLRGDLRQADLGLAFRAAVEGRRATLQDVRAQAGGGTLVGSGTFDLDAPRAFTVSARATNFDPSRFVAVPKATLDGTVVARGTLSAPFAVHADVTLAKGSRFAGLDVAGSARGDFTPATAKGVAVDLSLGTSKIVLNGASGAPGDALAYDIDIPKLAELRPLATRYAKLALPDPLEGVLRARGTITGDRTSPGITVNAHATSLAWGRTSAVASVDVKGSIAPGRTSAGAVPLTARAIALDVATGRVTLAQGSVDRVKVIVDGTLAQHRATLAASNDTLDVSMSVTGGLADTKRAGGAVETAWSGSIEKLANRGAYAFALAGPARMSVAASRFELADAHVGIAEGHIDVSSLVVDEGRVSSQGSFTGVPVSTAARMLGRPMPFGSTMEVGGAWSIAASPRLTGTFDVHREKGDWYASDGANLDPTSLALGIEVLELKGRFADDALAATARLRSTRAGTADASFNLAAGAVAGRIDANAAFTAKLTADLASLRPLQPLIGTAAVMDGRARVAIDGRGTLAEPVLEGTMSGDALRFDLPQYGVHLKDGVLRARLANRAIVLDEFSFAGGAGKFSAKGTIARAATAETSAAGRVEWEATDFTIVSRPDLRLVADGKGTIELRDGKLALVGSINMDEGRVEYEPARVGVLSDDVVIVGQPRRDASSSFRDLPLLLDMQVSLGRDFRFSGEGLDTRLAGRVHVTTTPLGTLAAKGTIRAVAGTYYVFGQKLDIDRGQLLFDGPIDNPALDVVALRKNLSVEAGVELSGTVKVPRVRLVSNPPVPDGEKLSWLITGQGLDRANRNDLALLGAASASLMGQGKRPITTQIANRLGLDDISVRDAGTSATTGTSTQVVAFGKRISDRLTLVYEQGLTVATNALRIEYALSRTLTLRAEAGTVSSIGLYFRRNYD